jgi:proline racemase
MDWNARPISMWDRLLISLRSSQSPGTAAVMTKLYHEGRLPLHTDFIHESIVGTQFIGRLKGESKVIGSEDIPLVTCL